MAPLALFDLDDTLIDRRAAFDAWADEFIATHGLGASALAFLTATDAGHHGPMDSFFTVVCRTFGVTGSPDELWRQYRRRMPELASCQPADLHALKRLRAAGWLIGIVTNGMPDNQVGKISNTGLDRVAHAWCVSGEAGVRKPEPAIFHLAARRCGADPAQGGWMVGDDLVLDVAGGRAAGFRTIWVRRTGRPAPDPDHAPDFTVGSVCAAVDAILDTGHR